MPISGGKIPDIMEIASCSSDRVISSIYSSTQKGLLIFHPVDRHSAYAPVGLWATDEPVWL
jgi:hypothetical protein